MWSGVFTYVTVIASQSLSAQSVESVLSGQSPPSYTSSLIDDQLLRLGISSSWVFPF